MLSGTLYIQNQDFEDTPILNIIRIPFINNRLIPIIYLLIASTRFIKILSMNIVNPNAYWMLVGYNYVKVKDIFEPENKTKLKIVLRKFNIWRLQTCRDVTEKFGERGKAVL